ncbi:MAG: dihydroorotate dehydrogenase [Candidatus Micrarchaeota archaeon]
MSPNFLETKLCGVRLANPTILASGYLGTSADLLARVAKSGAGAVTSKSCSLKARAGNPNPTVIAWENTIFNAVGLSNPGVEEEIEELRACKKITKTPIIASIFEESVEGYGEVVARISEAKPDFIEVNLSCPHHKWKFGKVPAVEAALARKVISRAKESTRIPIIAKLSPNVTDISEIARAVEEGGTDAISAINTFGGMRINVHARKPILSNKFGGISGPSIKPMALKCVNDISRAVEIPVIGIGGIITGEDAIEFFMAGASAVGIGSAIYYRGMGAFKLICREMEGFMRAHGHKKLSELRLQE